MQNSNKNLIPDDEMLKLDKASADLTLLFHDGFDIINYRLQGQFARCDKIDGIEVLIYTKDHSPAHFHIKCNNPRLDCKFSIDNCELISGDMPSKYYKKLKTWFNDGYINGDKHIIGKEVLQEKWNEFHATTK